MRPLTYILLFVLLTCVFTLVGCVMVTNAFMQKVIAHIHSLQGKIDKTCI